MALALNTLILPKALLGARARPAASRPSLVPRAASEPTTAPAKLSRRETILSATTLPALASIFGKTFPGDTPTDLGVQAGGGLQGCPTTPNCFSSAAPPGDSHYTAPLSFDKAPQAAIADVLAIIAAYPLDMGFDGGGAVITKKADNYIYANFASKLFGFVDDVEFLFEDGKMSIRTASRLGESDGGVNAKRIAYFTRELKNKGWSA